MRKVTLRKALQIKKNLIGEINEYKNTFVNLNSQRQDVKIDRVDVSLAYNNYLEKTNLLIHLKTELSKANISIYAYIAKVEEIKTQISVYNTLDTSEKYTEIDYEATPIRKLVFDKIVFLNATDVSNKVKELKEKLEELLDKIDYHNSTTYIEIF